MKKTRDFETPWERPKTMVVICGGRSAEHEVSVRSAQTVVRALSEEGVFKPIIVGVSRSGTRYLFNRAEDIAEMAIITDELGDKAEPMALVRFPDKTRAFATRSSTLSEVDIFFPLNHGAFGEDGRTQGYLDTLSVPYLGSGVEASVLGMNKILTRWVLQQHGINVLPFKSFKKDDDKPSFSEICYQLGATSVFVKPVSSGSSLGVTRVDSHLMWQKALEQAFAYGNQIMVEQALVCRELECGVLCRDDGETLEASGIGEIVVSPQHSFYTYTAKYVDPQGSTLHVPADIPGALSETLRSIALKVCRALGVEGYGRVDFLLSHKGDIFVNEINTIPGMTSISLFPRLWAHQGVTLHQCLMRMVTAALVRHKRPEAEMAVLEDDTFESDGDALATKSRYR